MKAIINHADGDARRLLLEVPNWDKTLSEFLEDVKCGVSEFLEETEEGREVLYEYGNKFTWLHLARYMLTSDCFAKAGSLHKAFDAFGVGYFRLETIAADIETDGWRADDNLYVQELL